MLVKVGREQPARSTCDFGRNILLFRQDFHGTFLTEATRLTLSHS